MAEAVEALPFDAESVAAAEETAEAELTDAASLAREEPEPSPHMHSLHLDSPLLLPDAVIHGQRPTDEATTASSVDEEMYNHHALLALQDTLQQQASRPPSVPLTSSSLPHSTLPLQSDPSTVAPLTVASAAVAFAGRQQHSAQHQKRLDAYYLRLQAYHLQRALADEEKQQLDDRRDRILEQHTLTRLKQAMRQQHRQPLQPTQTDTLHDSNYASLSHPLTPTDPSEAALSRQAQIAALREARLAHKRRVQQMYADVAALRRENEEIAEEQLRRAREAAEEAAIERRARMRQQRAEQQQRAKHVALEREASAHFVTIATSIAQQVGQLERKEWRDNRAGDTRQAVQHRKQQSTQHREQVEAVKTENYHRRQINALLQQQAAQALLAQRQQTTQQRQQQHRIALLSTTLTQRAVDKHVLPFQLPPSAVQSSPPPAAAALSSQTDTTASWPVSSSHTPILPFSNASMNSSLTASPALTAQPASGDILPATSPLAPLLFLLENRAKREAERKIESKG